MSDGGSNPLVGEERGGCDGDAGRRIVLRRSDAPPWGGGVLSIKKKVQAVRMATEGGGRLTDKSLEMLGSSAIKGILTCW